MKIEKGRYIFSKQFIGEIVKYDFNSIWNPKLGHFAIKRPNGEYITPIATLISLNQYDLVFINREDFKKEYTWIPTMEDLLLILNPNVDYAEFSEYLINVLRVGVPIEKCLLEIIIQKKLVNENSDIIDFSEYRIRNSMDLDKETIDKKSDFIRNFY